MRQKKSKDENKLILIKTMHEASFIVCALGFRNALFVRVHCACLRLSCKNFQKVKAFTLWLLQAFASLLLQLE